MPELLQDVLLYLNTDFVSFASWNIFHFARGWSNEWNPHPACCEANPVSFCCIALFYLPRTIKSLLLLNLDKKHVGKTGKTRTNEELSNQRRDESCCCSLSQQRLQHVRVIWTHLSSICCLQSTGSSLIEALKSRLKSKYSSCAHLAHSRHPIYLISIREKR